MAKRFHSQRKEEEKLPRINRQINTPKVRVVIDGKGVELMDTRDAVRLAEDSGLDLVEVSAGQDPPVCKIIDFGKWRFDQQKKKKLQAKNQHVVEIKEIKFKPKIGDHDYEIKLKRAVEFLEEGDKVKVSLRFRGREITHPEIGMELVQRFLKDVEAIASPESPPRQDGRQIVCVVVPSGAAKKPAKPTEKQRPQKSTDEKRTEEKKAVDSEADAQRLD
ncbi:MAG: translation initiation factor IF-3 [Leptonema sp. (in: Bacteria)]|nr:translation initiation factor IF-3 [Leptonema sp. (in: bacteria)]